MSILANYIYILGYLLEHLPSRASLLVLLFLFLRVLLLYFLPLLGLLRALRYLLPIVLTILRLRFPSYLEIYRNKVVNKLAKKGLSRREIKSSYTSLSYIGRVVREKILEKQVKKKKIVPY